MKTLRILDCTLRDGGYYLDWDFSTSTVEKYLKAVVRAGVDIIELGFRFLPQDRFLGAYAYSTDGFLRSLELPRENTLAVMINGKDFVGSKERLQSLRELFRPRDESAISLVRIAIHIEAVESMEPLVETLRELNYGVAINLMQTGGKEKSVIERSVSCISRWDLEAVYFADSLGNMLPGDVQQTTGLIRKHWDGEIGFHAHNNKSMALVNSLTAIECGASWVDSTILGMGRGAGNTKTESLLIELSQRGLGTYFPEQLLDVVLGEFAALHRKYQWGPHMLYHLSAASNIHPTYVQEMLSDNEYSTAQLKSAMDRLREKTGTDSFSKQSLRSALEDYKGETSPGSWSPGGLAKGRGVLILGSGPSVGEYREGIVSFIQEHRPLVLAVNLSKPIASEWIDFYVSAHKFRFLVDSAEYADLGRPLICPYRDVPEGVREQIQWVDVLNYGMSVNEAEFGVGETSCIVPRPLTAAYALAIATAALGTEVFLVGFDGYATGSRRHHEMEVVFSRYRALDKALHISSLTPTSYSVSQGSIFAPALGRGKFHSKSGGAGLPQRG